MVRVESVAPNSIGAEIGLMPGTELISVNGREVHDFLDWEFLTADDQFVVLTRSPEGEAVEFDIERPEGMPMGIELEPPRIRRCGNRCDFCFVDGLPSALREPLYIRDDDYRLSFRHGNFATLTNLKPLDVERIIEYRLSPLYVSVHATDPIVRRRLLRNPRAPDIVPQLQSLARYGISFHTQIVLQPGVNDRTVLHDSLRDLWTLGQAVLSVSVVPVGLTEFSKHALVREPTRDECGIALDIVESFASAALRERGSRWVFGSDELYLVADRPLPPTEAYGDFEQVENGVGSVRYLQKQIAASGDSLPSLTEKTFGVVTGTAMGRLMPDVLRVLREAVGARFELIVITNDLFGPRVTTAGLLTGSSMVRALADRGDLDLALIPGESLNDRGMFVDSMTLQQLEASVPVPIAPSLNFADVLTDYSAE
jgi:putative radical SAM enzyme (TIGR03279 family)